MRVLDYILVTLLVGAFVVYGAQAVGGAIAASINQSAVLIEDSGHAR
jgi:hypothetical protein